MKLLALLSFAVAASGVKGLMLEARDNPQGIDVSSHQPDINWPAVKANGIQFAYIKATEGTGMYHITMSPVSDCSLNIQGTLVLPLTGSG